jgi:hypothetical protein
MPARESWKGILVLLSKKERKKEGRKEGRKKKVTSNLGFGTG